MSLWKFGNAELEVDFTDAAFMEKFERAYEKMEEDAKHTLKVGKQSEIIRSHCAVFFEFFDSVFGKGSSDKLFEGKVSIELCIQAAQSLAVLRANEDDRYRRMQNKYNVQLRGHNKKIQNYKGRKR